MLYSLYRKATYSKATYSKATTRATVGTRPLGSRFSGWVLLACLLTPLNDGPVMAVIDRGSEPALEAELEADSRPRSESDLGVSAEPPWPGCMWFG